MDRSQAKSAPPRLKSKFVKNRTNAMKEIRAWIRKDEEFSMPEASRMSGQLSDNVTEERMLKAKLWELSKERYKFLSQNSYEKKVFQDRQQRKANSRRVVSASADGRSRHTSGEARRERRSSLGDAPVQKPRIRNARLALLNRLDPTNKKKGNNKKSNTDDVSNKDGGQTPTRNVSRANSRNAMLQHKDSSLSVKSAQGGISASVASGGQKLAGSTMFDNKQQIKAQNGAFAEINSQRPASSTSVNPTTQSSKSKPTVTSNNSDDTKIKNIFARNVNNDSTTSAQQQQQQQQSSSSSATGGQSSWGKTGSEHQCLSRYGMRVESKITDPRYALLEERLSPLIRSNTASDVGSIVDTMESLHIRPRRRPADSSRSRTKIEAKALEFIKEKGFVF